MNTVCLTQLWGLGPKPEQDDLCHPDCARLKVTGQLVDKMQLYQHVQCRTGRGRLRFQEKLYCSSRWGEILCFKGLWEKLHTVASDLQSRIGHQLVFLALGESLNLSGSGSAPVKWGQLNLTTRKSCWLVNACEMLHSAIKQSIVLRNIWFAVTIVLLWNFMGKLCQETKWLMCAIHVGIGRWGTDGFSKASNLPQVHSLKIQEASQEHLKCPGTESSVMWIWGCRMRLWQVAEELFAPPISSCSYSWPCPASYPICFSDGTVCTVLKNRLVVWFRWQKKGDKNGGKFLPLLVSVSRWILSLV